MNNFKTFTLVLLVMLFFAPAIGAIPLVIGQDAQTNQYAGLQWIVMGVYNLPFILVSMTTLLVGDKFYKKEKIGTAASLFFISIVSSLVGIVLMIAWGLGIFA